MLVSHLVTADLKVEDHVADRIVVLKKFYIHKHCVDKLC